MVGNSALARLHVVVHAEPGRPLAAVDQAALQASIAAAVRSWDDDLVAEAERQLGPEHAAAALRTCADGIPEAYKAGHHAGRGGGRPGGGAAAAAESAPFAIRLAIIPNECWRLRLFRLSPLTLSDVLPQLQHMGLEVLDEHPYEFGSSTLPFWIYDFGIRGGRPAATAAEAERGTGRLRGRAHRAVAAARPRTTTSTAWCWTRS